MSDSFVRNCLLQPRVIGEVVAGKVTQTDRLFREDEEGRVIATLDGYAVVPVEEWARLSTKAGEPVALVSGGRPT